MKKIDVVIGLNYGDEGKGLTTDYLCAQAQDPKKVAVVRFNGGPQAGHTVVNPNRYNNDRVVFHHIGSGTLNKSATILSYHFLVNPIMFVQEIIELYEQTGIIPGKDFEIFVDPDCPVTTPFDVFVNQAVETKRGNKRHGSCGMGIHETVLRTQKGYGITVSDLEDEDTVREKLLDIKELWLAYTLAHHKIYKYQVDTSVLDDSIEQFIEFSKDFLKVVKLYKVDDACALFDHLVFEGAQGLLLDRNNMDEFPHVTDSNTGLKNVSDILYKILDREDNDYNITLEDIDLNLYYITRCYLTRHGAGKIHKELPNHITIYDETNKPNDFQGTMKFGELDLKKMAKIVKEDFQHFEFRGAKNVKTNVVVTWCDAFNKIYNGKQTLSGLLDDVKTAVSATQVYCSAGPARKDVRLYDPAKSDSLYMVPGR